MDLIQEYEETRAWLDDHVQWVPDIAPEFSGVEGTTVYAAPVAEINAVITRMDMLEQLCALREPASMGYCQGFTCTMTNAEFAAWTEYERTMGWE